MKYKAVIADVDGTLVEPGEQPCLQPSITLVKVVKKVIGRGVKFSIATGRSLSWVTEIINAFDLQTPIILDNGARIYDCKYKKYIWETLLPKEISKNILFSLKENKNLKIIVTDDGNRFEDLSKIRDWKISKILILGVTPDKAGELCQMFRKIRNIQVTRSVSGIGATSESVHITNYNATKQVATEKLLDYWQIKKEEIIGIGDSYNDFPLLMASGLKVAMGNAVPEIKEIADYIAPSYEEDGVIDVLEKFILNN